MASARLLREFIIILTFLAWSCIAHGPTCADRPSVEAHGPCMLQAKRSITGPSPYSMLQHRRSHASANLIEDVTDSSQNNMSSMITEYRDGYQIPLLLHITGKQASAKKLPQQVKSNIEEQISRNKDFHVRYWGDDACLAYIRQHFAADLERIWNDARRGHYDGAYHGDICRTLVLYREGGFYMDLDVELAVPLIDLIDKNTTFMNVIGSNALFATSPNSSILKQAVDGIHSWYKRHDSGENVTFLGPSVLGDALQSTCECGESSLYKQSKWKCKNHTIQLYKEVAISCSDVSAECPADRRQAASQGNMPQLNFAYKSLDGNVMAWPRFASCTVWGCGGTGWIGNVTAWPAGDLSSMPFR